MRGSVAAITRWRNGRRRTSKPAPAAVWVVIGRSVRGSIIVRPMLGLPPLVVRRTNPGNDAEDEDEHPGYGEERVRNLVIGAERQAGTEEGEPGRHHDRKHARVRHVDPPGRTGALGRAGTRGPRGDREGDAKHHEHADAQDKEAD